MLKLLSFRFFFFFFQAEDGIRDVAVTGVQTCALPIFRSTLRWGVGIAAVLALGVAIGRWSARRGESPSSPTVIAGSDQASTLAYRVARSEERRVGKEGRARWASCAERTKKSSEEQRST